MQAVPSSPWRFLISGVEPDKQRLEFADDFPALTGCEIGESSLVDIF
ncbi:hypothetical protein MalM14_27650 [Gimesia chilikensis]|nr:hypothetical protein MalM14_27650 [Gimesia chilikensis]